MSEIPVSESTILVADDEPSYRYFMRDLLEQQGYKVACASDGEEALQIVKRQPVQLALLDVMMPKRTGFSACRRLKSAPVTRLIPVILVTGLNSVDDHIRGIESGADDFLSKPVQTAELLARVRSLLKLKQFTDELEYADAVIDSLALSVEAKDPYTNGHCARLSNYSIRLAQRLGLSQEQCLALKRGGIVHDIGKVAVPEGILLSPRPLTPEERAIMESHTVIGERICKPLKSFRLVLPIIRGHHEKLDGSGYPDGLRGDEIPLIVRIMTTVDVYDALSTDRCYRKAYSKAESLNQMRTEVNKGWWDKTLVDELESVLNLPAKIPVEKYEVTASGFSKGEGARPIPAS
jgi:putative two-component system response regulator